MASVYSLLQCRYLHHCITILVTGESVHAIIEPHGHLIRNDMVKSPCVIVDQVFYGLLWKIHLTWSLISTSFCQSFGEKLEVIIQDASHYLCPPLEDSVQLSSRKVWNTVSHLVSCQVPLEIWTNKVEQVLSIVCSEWNRMGIATHPEIWTNPVEQVSSFGLPALNERGFMALPFCRNYYCTS